MDNLTHSLVGALIGQAGLKRRTGLAMPALIIGANIPDIDGACMLLGDQQHLALRRGITHGPIAWVVLPLLLAGLLYGWDRWQTKRGRRPEKRLPVHFGWLFLLSLIGCLSHPAMDWMNTYGVRLLEPFNSQWFHGDVLFIIDLWLWIGMGLAVWLSLRREKAGGAWQRPARVALAAVLAYIGLNSAITYLAERQARLTEPYPTIVMATQVPLAFWRREMLTGNGDGIWRVNGERLGDVPLARCDLAGAATADVAVRSFLFWSLTPFVERSADGWNLRDARYASRGSGSFTVPLPEGTCGE